MAWFPLRMDREIIIGRSGELDMVLVEDMVSRKHAKISTQNGDLTISDLGNDLYRATASVTYPRGTRPVQIVTLIYR